ncbi:MAG: DNA repair protein RadA [Bdellovibrionales bacterium]|nr:DNA repair protein RadA [Bdellovibrionales bacterium]
MAKKAATAFVCSECGASSTRWEGRCRECGQWNTLVEQKISPSSSAKSIGVNTRPATAAEPRPLHSMDSIKVDSAERIHTGFSETDRVLGGGLVEGSILLFGGEPGIGKSTLLLQLIGSLASRGTRCLYVSGEESASQVAARAKRLDIPLSDNLLFLSTSSLDEALGAADKARPHLVVVDSVQTLSSDAIESSAGTVSQVREITQSFLNLSKNTGIITLLVGHVTKEGQIAGPRLLEHMVDGVFYFEMAANGGYRMLRGQKNRFGATHELAVFEMTSKGMAEVLNPSARFLAERSLGMAGSAVVAHLEGSRPFLTEVQALTQKCYAGYPRRTVQGVDQNRVSVLLAIIEKRLGITLSDQDVYCKVANGARIEEPASDLPILFSLVSAVTNKPIPADVILVGEVGLGGELRSVSGLGARLNEAKTVGLRKAIIPKACERDAKEVTGVKIYVARDIGEVQNILKDL